jgi:hypothetical protein
MANPVAGIDIVARLDRFEAELAKIPNIGAKEAKALATQMSKEIKAAEKAARDAAAASREAAKASKEAAQATKGFGDAAGAAGGSAQKLAGALGLLSDDAGQAAQSFADFADVGEVAAAAFAALNPVTIAFGVALGAAAVAALDYVTEGKKVEAHLKAVKKDAEDAAPAIAALADEQITLAVATGKLTEEQATALRGAASAQQDYVGSVEDNIAANTALYEEQARLTDQIAKLQAKQEEGFDAGSRRAASHAAETSQLASMRERLAEVTAEIARNNSEVGKAAGVFVARVSVGEQIAAALTKQREEEEALRAATEAGKREALERAAAEKAFEAAVRGLIDAENDAFKVARERAKIEDENTKAAERAAERRAEAEYTLWARQQEIEKDRQELYKKGAEDRAAMAADERAALLDAAASFSQAIGELAAAQLETHEAALSEVRAEIEELDDLLGELSSTTVDAASLSGQALVDAYKAGQVAAEDLSDAQKAALEARLTAEREAAAERETIERQAAEDAFYMQQAAAIASTIVAGAQAVVAAFQLGPVAGAIAAAGIGALTGIQLGIIAGTKPEFHAGGFVRDGYPDEVDIRALSGEGIANRQAMSVPENRAALSAMNAGQAVGGVTVLRIGRKEAREIARTDIRSDGIIPQTMRSIARRAGSGAGLSGRGVLA